MWWLFRKLGTYQWSEMFSILGNRQLFVNEKPHIPYNKITTVQEQRVGNSGRQSPSSSEEGTWNLKTCACNTVSCCYFRIILQPSLKIKLSYVYGLMFFRDVSIDKISKLVTYFKY